MHLQSVPQLLFENLADRSLVVKRSDVEMTSDAGLLPIREFDRNWRITERMIECLSDKRTRCDHSIAEMLRQRLFGILADYEDCNDHDDLRSDPAFKIIAGRTPNDDPLASQPTLSRFENSITPRMLEALRELLVTTGIERLQQKHEGRLPDSVTLDIDPTDVATHGPLKLTQRFDKSIQLQLAEQRATGVIKCENDRPLSVKESGQSDLLPGRVREFRIERHAASGSVVDADIFDAQRSVSQHLC